MFKRGPNSRLLTYSSIRFFSQFSGSELSFILTNEYFASQILKPVIFFLSLTHTVLVHNGYSRSFTIHTTALSSQKVQSVFCTRRCGLQLFLSKYISNTFDLYSIQSVEAKLDKELNSYGTCSIIQRAMSGGSLWTDSTYEHTVADAYDRQLQGTCTSLLVTYLL